MDITNNIETHQRIEKTIATVSRLFNYREIRTPHFEQSELFHRSVGSDSDIVNKETYDFKDRGGRLNTLRPEGTAGVVRAYIENKLYTQPVMPHKYYYYGSMFRYERPQKGRFREFRQFGAEVFGSHLPAIDAEVIAYAVTLLKALKLNDVTVHINSLGDHESKDAYKAALKDHLNPHVSNLCQDCQRRYNDNPLRILDCKVDKNHASFVNLPKAIDYLTDEDKQHFQTVLDTLQSMNIKTVVDHQLVRGLDYYTHTVFEIKVSEVLLGNQNTICGGGRYNHLVSDLGGPQTPSVGFAFGIDRLVIALESASLIASKPSIHAYFIVLGDHARTKAMQLMQQCRMLGLMCDADYTNRSLKAQFKQSAFHDARFVVIMGDAEVDQDVVKLKDQQSQHEETVASNDLAHTMIDYLTRTHHSCEDCDKGERT